MKSRVRPSLKRRLLSTLKGQRLYDPTHFLSPRRIDLAAKTVFARAYIEGNDSSWPEYVYREHIRAFNNFYEEEPSKLSYDDFKSAFIETIEGISNDSWKHRKPVPRNGNYVVNGAHRVAASLVLNDRVNTVIPKTLRSDVYNYDFFRSDRGAIYRIDEDVLDYMTIEYVSQKRSNIFVAVIFPTAEGYRDEAYRHFASLGEIVNVKSFKHDEFIGKEVIKQLYCDPHNDSWNIGRDFEGAKYKASFCFDGVEDLQVYVIEANLSETTRVEEKKYLRDLWGKDKHSIHITDTIEEANRLVRMFFNANSRKLLKVDRKSEFKSEAMYEMFAEYKRLAPVNFIDRESVAIEGSAVFDLLNIRDGRDIDYISRRSDLRIKGSGIDIHDADENVYHSSTVDDILTNPDYYFYYKGFKFVDIVEMYKYKRSRSQNGEIKDIDDVALIDEFIDRNPQYGTGLDTTDRSSKVKPVVSIIVPIYNTDTEILKACLDSIGNQTYDNLDVILVNDGSNRSTRKFLEGYVSDLKSTGVDWTLISQDNRGLSAARNAGFEVATGKYVQFLDSDDYFDKLLIQSAVHIAEDNNLDIVVENFIQEDFISGDKAVFLKTGLLPNKPVFKLSDLQDRKLEVIPYNVWSKLFKRDFLKKNSILHDEDLMRSEDVLFSYTALLRASRIGLLKQPFITYRDNIPSSNTGTNDRHPVDSVEAWRKLYDVMTSMDVYSDYRPDFEQSLLGSVYWHYKKLKTDEGRRALRERAKELFRDLSISISDLRRAEIELLDSRYEYVLDILNDVNDNIARLEADKLELLSKVNRLTHENAALSQPNIKTSSRKLAGSVKRRIKRDIKKVGRS